MMQSLSNKRILLGVTGGIAAYKSAELIRTLSKAGADVRVVMTAAAMEFITPLTLQALSGNPVHHALLDPEAEAGMGHIELARWADAILIAPASADSIARLTAGMGNDLLTTLCLASSAPLVLAPAMNQAMWSNESTQANIQRLLELKGKRLHLLGPDEGVQACGDVGPGRMLEPEQLAQQLSLLFEAGTLAGKRVVITAGPTREAIDPVRYISNHSSGKMGFALAEAARDAGALVTLICGPVNLATPERIQRLDVISAEDMLQAALGEVDSADVFIAAAAVADYRPATCADHKIKKTVTADTLELKLIKNPDIVATIAQHENRPFTVGFAAETQNVEDYAHKKMQSKNLDMIVANDVSRSDIGFNSDQNAVTVFSRHSQLSMAIAQSSKYNVATQIITQIAQQYNS